jgi:hypothetical protein
MFQWAASVVGSESYGQSIPLMVQIANAELSGDPRANVAATMTFPLFPRPTAMASSRGVRGGSSEG